MFDVVSWFSDNDSTSDIRVTDGFGGLPYYSAPDVLAIDGDSNLSVYSTTDHNNVGLVSS